MKTLCGAENSGVAFCCLSSSIQRSLSKYRSCAELCRDIFARHFSFFSPLHFPPPRPPVRGGTVSPFVHLFKAAPPLLFFSVRPSPVLLLPSPPPPCSCCSLDCAIWGNGGGGGSLSGLGNPLPPFDFPQE